MIKTGQLFEKIVEMLTRFRQEIQTSSSLGLLNTNKHAENFMKRILNLTYNIELENLNKDNANYPGLDLGDTGDGIAFQITSTKKSEKIDDTLKTCLKHGHYKTFHTIKVFVLTTKQTSYTLKTITEPHFSFSTDKNIMDFEDLLRDIQNIDPIPLRGLHDYIKSELDAAIGSVQGKDTDAQKYFLDVVDGMTKSKMPNFYIFQAKISIASENISAPNILSGLSIFLNKQAFKNQYFSVFTEAARDSSSHKQILYMRNPQATGISNFFHAYSLVIEPSSITIEKADYANNEFLTNLDAEIVSLLIVIIFLSRYATGNSLLSVSIHLESNNRVFLAAQNSMVIRGLFSNYLLKSPYQFNEPIPDIYTSTLVDLLQNLVHGFMAEEADRFTDSPFLTLDHEKTVWHIDRLKSEFGIDDVSVY